MGTARTRRGRATRPAAPTTSPSPTAGSRGFPTALTEMEATWLRSATKERPSTPRLPLTSPPPPPPPLLISLPPPPTSPPPLTRLLLLPPIRLLPLLPPPTRLLLLLPTRLLLPPPTRLLLLPPTRLLLLPPTRLLLLLPIRLLLLLLLCPLTPSKGIVRKHTSSNPASLLMNKGIMFFEI